MSETQGYPLGAPPYRSLGPPLASAVRQPYLGSAPIVSSVTGLGSGPGGGAFVLNQGSDADQSQGLVAAIVGLAPATSGSIALSFPAGVTAGQYVLAADWASFSAIVVTGNVLSASWTLTDPNGLQTGERRLIAYRWGVSS